jgi:hypothetical protein
MGFLRQQQDVDAAYLLHRTVGPENMIGMGWMIKPVKRKYMENAVTKT